MADGATVYLPEMSKIECKTRDALILLAAGNTSATTAKILNKRYPEDEPITSKTVISYKQNHPEDYLTAVEWYAEIMKMELQGVEQAVMMIITESVSQFEPVKTPQELRHMVAVLKDLSDVKEKIKTSDKPGREIKGLSEAEGTLKSLMAKNEDEKNDLTAV